MVNVSLAECRHISNVGRSGGENLDASDTAKLEEELLHGEETRLVVARLVAVGASCRVLTWIEDAVRLHDDEFK